MKFDWPTTVRERGTVVTFLGLLVMTVRLATTWAHAIGRLQGQPCSCSIDVPQFSFIERDGRFHVVDVDGDSITSFDDQADAADFLEQLRIATRGP